MKKNIDSSSRQAEENIKDYLLIDSPQIVLDMTLAILILISFNIPSIWTRLVGSTDSVTQPYSTLGSYIHYLTPWLYDFLHSSGGARAVQMLLWLFIGCIVYLVIWFTGSFLTSLRNDVVADSYLHPKFYNRSGFWLSVLSRKIVFVCLGVFLLVFLYIGPSLLFQLSVGSYQAIIDFSLRNSLLFLVSSFVTSVITVHLFYILLGLISRNWKIIYSDL